MFYAIKSPRARRTPEYVPVITPDVGLLNLVVYSHSGTQPGLCCAVPDVLMVYRRFSFPVYSAVLCAAVAIPASQPAGCCTRRPCLMGVGGGSDLYTTSSLHYNIFKTDIVDKPDKPYFSLINRSNSLRTLSAVAFRPIRVATIPHDCF